MAKYKVLSSVCDGTVLHAAGSQIELPADSPDVRLWVKIGAIVPSVDEMPKFEKIGKPKMKNKAGKR